MQRFRRRCTLETIRDGGIEPRGRDGGLRDGRDERAEERGEEAGSGGFWGVDDTDGREMERVIQGFRYLNTYYMTC